MTPDFTKKPTVNPIVIEKLCTVLTGMGVPNDIVDKIKSILSAGKENTTNLEDNHPDGESPEEDKTDIGPESGEEVDAMKQMDDPKRKLNLNGVKVICISE